MPSPPNRRFSPSKPPDSDTVTAVSGESHSQRERKVPSTLSALRGGTRLAFGGSSHVAATLPLKPASTTSTERSQYLLLNDFLPVRCSVVLPSAGEPGSDLRRYGRGAAMHRGSDR